MFSKFKFCGYLNLWVFKICGYSNLWVHKICDDTKFQVSGREYQNICVLCISCEQKNICAFFHICFLPYVQNMPCELAFILYSHIFYSSIYYVMALVEKQSINNQCKAFVE